MPQNTTNYSEQITELFTIIDNYGTGAEASNFITALLQQVELYGRLHETIEAFQSGSISAAVYSLRHDDIMQQLQSQQEGVE